MALMLNSQGQPYESLSSIDMDYDNATSKGRKLSPPAFDTYVNRYRRSFQTMDSAWLTHEFTMLAYNERRGNKAYRRAIMEHAATLSSCACAPWSINCKLAHGKGTD